jgi:hypothetical protein
MSLQNIQRKMQGLYHGVDNDVDHTSFAELCLEGKMQFSYLWNLEDTMMNALINIEIENGETEKSFLCIESSRFLSKLPFYNL